MDIRGPVPPSGRISTPALPAQKSGRAFAGATARADAPPSAGRGLQLAAGASAGLPRLRPAAALRAGFGVAAAAALAAARALAGARLRAAALAPAAADAFRFGDVAGPVAAGAAAAIKNSSSDLPAASAARSQSGRLPMPPQVLPAPSAYFGAWASQ